MKSVLSIIGGLAMGTVVQWATGSLVIGLIATFVATFVFSMALHKD